MWCGFKISVALLCFFLMSAPVQAAVVIGSLSNNPNSEIKKFLPLANYLSSRLDGASANKGKIRIEKSPSKIAQALKEDKIDIFIGNPFIALALHRNIGAKFFLQTISRGEGVHPSVVFMRSDKAVKKIKDLKGKKIAFDDPLSVFGYFLPKWLLMENGLKLVPLKKITDEVPPGEVGYVFSRDDSNTLLWVKKEKIDVGAVNYSNYKNQAKESLDQLKIISRTFPLPPMVLMYREDLSQDLVLRLKSILLKMHETDEGKKILDNIDDISSFKEIPPKALQPLLKSYDYLGGELSF